MKTDSATARPISRSKCFQKHVSVNYFRKIRACVPNEPPLMNLLHTMRAKWRKKRMRRLKRKRRKMRQRSK